MNLFILLAQAADGAQPAPAPGPFSAFQPLVPLILIFVVGWFLLFRPMQKQERERKAMVAALKKNDRVIAAGGILGTVAQVKDNDDEVTLKVDDNVRIRVLRSSIVRVLKTDEEEKKEEKSA